MSDGLLVLVVVVALLFDFTNGFHDTANAVATSVSTRALSPRVAATRWGRSLRDGAAVLVAGRNGLRLPFRLRGDPAAVTDADLPIATGGAPPRARGNAPLTIGIRTAARGAAPSRVGTKLSRSHRSAGGQLLQPSEL